MEIKRAKNLMKRVVDYTSFQMKQTPGVSEAAALELLCSVSLWLHQYYAHCENPDQHPMPTIKPAMKNIHNLM